MNNAENSPLTLRSETLPQPDGFGNPPVLNLPIKPAASTKP
jgi:hypothetical protein